MSSLDYRQNSSVENMVGSGPSPSETAAQEPFVEQLPFPDQTPLPGDPPQIAPSQFIRAPGLTRPLVRPTTMSGVTQPFTAPPNEKSPIAHPITPPAMTRPLPDLGASPNITRALPEVQSGMLPVLQTGALPIIKSTTTSLREPVVIRGSGRKKRETVRPPRGRRLVVHLAATSVLIFILLVTLIAVAQTGTDAQGGKGSSIFQPLMNIVNTKGNNTGLIAQQAATATAVTQDGFDPGNVTYAGVQSGPSGGGGGLNRFFYGQCTYWANMRYHALTGHWVPWLGNADQWVYGAESSGWIVSATPHLHAIIVLQPGVQGAGWYGHVAIVEQINSNGSVVTSNWNWAGNWGTETFVTFTPGPGVSFVYYPGT
jgi:surface antigen